VVVPAEVHSAYPHGLQVLSVVVDGATRPFTSRAAIELWWMPPRSVHHSVHVAAIKRTQKGLIARVLLSALRIDLSASDLRQDICGHVGPPPARDTSALMAADPTIHEPLNSSFRVVLSRINCPEFVRRHCAHCDMCSAHRSLHEHCYGYRLWHYLVYGRASALSSIPPKRRFENYISIR
jgi:hypothetical protein